LAKGVLVKSNVAAPFTSIFLSSPLSSKLLVVKVVSDSTHKEIVLLLTLKSRLVSMLVRSAYYVKDEDYQLLSLT